MPFSAAHIEHVCDVAGCWTTGVPRRECELDAVIGENPRGFCRKQP